MVNSVGSSGASPTSKRSTKLLRRRVLHFGLVERRRFFGRRDVAPRNGQRDHGQTDQSNGVGRHAGEIPVAVVAAPIHQPKRQGGSQPSPASARTTCRPPRRLSRVGGQGERSLVTGGGSKDMSVPIRGNFQLYYSPGASHKAPTKRQRLQRNAIIVGGDRRIGSPSADLLEGRL